ncbi:disintegrin and metalloproteinase domain-containing protein 9-like isoform X2 [Lissotriton helveticus]
MSASRSRTAQAQTRRRCTVFVIRPLLCLLMISSALENCKGLQSLLPVSEITVPQRLLGRVEENTDSMIYEITIGGKKHFVYLVRQTFLPTDFAIYSNEKEDITQYYQEQMKTDCYYQGHVLDYPNSAVALRTCAGLRGLLEFSNVSYVIEPLQFLHGFKHLISRLDGENKHLYFLDNDTDPHSMEEKQQQMSSRIDSAKQFDSYGASVAAVNENMLKMISLLNTIFASLNIRIFMVSLDIWAESNPIDVSNGTITEKLDRFIRYSKRNAVKRRPYDIPLLLSVNGDMAGGMAYFGSICSPQQGALATFSGTVEKYSSIVAHLLGHSIGLYHDNFRTCKCPVTTCLMHTDAGVTTGVQAFSSCSGEDFNIFVLTFGASCLLNLPNLKARVNPALCGNRVVDKGEACDCGSATECQADPCCDVSCQLKGKATCAQGLCCRDCKILPRGAQCREVSDECDLPEYCDGVSPTCVSDVFQQNGNPCKKEKSYCYQGKCADRDAQCRQFFGSGSIAADPICFLESNVEKDRFGNCGFNKEGKYIGCSALGTLCGKLQCTYPSNLPIKGSAAAIIYYAPKKRLCTSIDFMKKDKIVDASWVPDGTICDKGKICVHQKCVLLTTLNNKCSSEAACNSNGVCNSNGNCHCNKGWNPPTCTEHGIGGSVDSGARMIEVRDTSEPADSSLIKCLLVGFGIFFPVVFIISVVIMKRRSIRRYFWRSEAYESEEETETDTFQTISS